MSRTRPLSPVKLPTTSLLCLPMNQPTSKRRHFDSWPVSRLSLCVEPTSHCCNNSTGCTLFCFFCFLHLQSIYWWLGMSSILGSWFKSLEISLTPFFYYAITQQDCEAQQTSSQAIFPSIHLISLPFPPASALLSSSQACSLKDWLSKFDYHAPVTIILP